MSLIGRQVILRRLAGRRVVAVNELDHVADRALAVAEAQDGGLGAILVVAQLLHLVSRHHHSRSADAWAQWTSPGWFSGSEATLMNFSTLALVGQPPNFT